MSLEITGHELRRDGKNAELRVSFNDQYYVLMQYREQPKGTFYSDFTVFRTAFGLYTFELTWGNNQRPEGVPMGPFSGFTVTEAVEYREAVRSYLQGKTGLLNNFLQFLEEMDF